MAYKVLSDAPDRSSCDCVCDQVWLCLRGLNILVLTAHCCSYTATQFVQSLFVGCLSQKLGLPFDVLAVQCLCGSLYACTRAERNSVSSKTGVSIVSSLQGYNALMSACETSHLTVVQYLLEKGADVSPTDLQVRVYAPTD